MRCVLVGVSLEAKLFISFRIRHCTLRSAGHSAATYGKRTSGSADNVSIAATLAEEQKKREHNVPLQVAGLQPAALFPAAFETSGRGGSGVDALLAWLGGKAQAAGMDAAEQTRRLKR